MNIRTFYDGIRSFSGDLPSHAPETQSKDPGQHNILQYRRYFFYYRIIQLLSNCGTFNIKFYLGVRLFRTVLNFPFDLEKMSVDIC